MTIPPVPSSATGELARCYVSRDPSGWRTVWSVDLRLEPFGEPYSSARDACRASRLVNEQIERSRS